MQVINFSEQNSIINQFMSELRDKSYQKNRYLFRHNIERIGELMAYEVSKTLDYKPKTITTPLGTIDIPLVKDDIVLGTVLRAGLPYHQGFLNMFDRRTLIIADPMLATGGSMAAAIEALLMSGKPKKIHVCCVIAAPEGIEVVKESLPDDATIWCASVDQGMNEHKYIVPGFGDCGDLCFGEKLQSFRKIADKR